MDRKDTELISVRINDPDFPRPDIPIGIYAIVVFLGPFYTCTSSVFIRAKDILNIKRLIYTGIAINAREKYIRLKLFGFLDFFDHFFLIIRQLFKLDADAIFIAPDHFCRNFDERCFIIG